METSQETSLSNVETIKKEWSKPVFEVISKDIIKGGHGASAESNTHHS